MSCPRPDKDVFHSWRDARRGARRVLAQSGYRLMPYVCGDHLHLTKDERPLPQSPSLRRLVSHRYLNRSPLRRVA